jgi:hypothetical protein
MKKTYSSPRLTEIGSASELEKVFGFPTSDEIKVELTEVSVAINTGAVTGSKTSVTVE